MYIVLYAFFLFHRLKIKHMSKYEHEFILGPVCTFAKNYLNESVYYEHIRHFTIERDNNCQT